MKFSFGLLLALFFQGTSFAVDPAGSGPATADRVGSATAAADPAPAPETFEQYRTHPAECIIGFHHECVENDTDGLCVRMKPNPTFMVGVWLDGDVVSNNFVKRRNFYDDTASACRYLNELRAARLCAPPDTSDHVVKCAPSSP